MKKKLAISIIVFQLIGATIGGVNAFNNNLRAQ